MEYIKLLRPKHWIKNLFVFLPLFFAGKIQDIHSIQSVLLGFVSFCLIASGIYIINDYRDIESDRQHPEKCNRPLASGKVKPSVALLLCAVLLIIGLSVSYLASPLFVIITGTYLLLNLGYSLGLKNVAILDIMIVASGFILRIKGGGVLADVPLSVWINVMVFLLATLIAIGKRRDDVLIQQDSGVALRKSLSGYNLEFLNAWLSILSAVIIIAYLMYTLSPLTQERLGTYRLYYTSAFVMAGLMRYLQLVFIENKTASPIKIVATDRFIQVVLLLWMISFYIIIYIPNDPIFRQ